MSLMDQNEKYKNRKIIVLDPKRIKLSSNRLIIENIKFYYHYRQIHDFIIQGTRFKQIDKRRITIPGLLNNHIEALYKTSLSEKTIKLIKEKRPSAILYIYTGYEPVISYENMNLTGLVELVFDRIMLIQD